MAVLVPFLSGLALALTAPTDASGFGGDGMPAGTAAPIKESMQIWSQLAGSFSPRTVAQVRIEQHIILRIAPMPAPTRERLMAIAPTNPSAPRMIERKMGDCLPMSWIAGGQPQGNSRLLLFLRDRRLVAANLEKACSARDFYRGFYVDKPNADGRLCADRDRILARSGARCEISSFRLLVPDD